MDLDEIGLGNDSVWTAAVADYIRVSASLTFVSICANDIGSEVAMALGKGLAVNTSLTTLNITHNKIGPDGAKALGEGLAVNTSLTTLDIDYNSIGPEGARLARGFRSIPR